jgi:hypothetical protein
MITNFFTTLVIFYLPQATYVGSMLQKEGKTPNSDVVKRKMVKKYSLTFIVILKCLSIVSSAFF